MKDVKPATDSTEISTRRRGATQSVSSISQTNSAAKEERTERNDRPGRNDKGTDRVERAPLRRGAEERRTGAGAGTGPGSDNADASADRSERTIRKRISPPPGAAETKVCERSREFETHTHLRRIDTLKNIKKKDLKMTIQASGIPL